MDISVRDIDLRGRTIVPRRYIAGFVITRGGTWSRANSRHVALDIMFKLMDFGDLSKHYGIIELSSLVVNVRGTSLSGVLQVLSPRVDAPVHPVHLSDFKTYRLPLRAHNAGALASGAIAGLSNSVVSSPNRTLHYDGVYSDSDFRSDLRLGPSSESHPAFSAIRILQHRVSLLLYKSEFRKRYCFHGIAISFRQNT